MGRFLVMDIVFYGGSMNYDQGTGNYQELKKITKWDGRQYTLVSRYALRYSLLETAKMMGLWKIADADELQLAGGEGNKKVIQPSTELLISGKILEYPEFDLFGYLVTSTKPQNFREAPVKISHAISMTPFNYDALFNANLGLANRIRKKYGDMAPNPFTAEEHITYYHYTIVADLDRIGKVDVYLQKNGEIQLEDGKYKFEKVERSSDTIKLLFKYKNTSKEVVQSNNVSGEVVELEKINILSYCLKQNETDPLKDRITKLLKAVLNLKRSIKGRSEDLSPKLMVVGIYKNHPYKTYKDRIILKDEYSEESYDEIEEDEKDGKRVLKIKHVISKSKKPLFEIIDADGNLENPQLLSENEILSFIDDLFSEKEEINEVRVFYDPGIEVQVKEKSDTN